MFILKITILKTGGTIGSSFDGEKIDVNKDTSLSVLKKFKEENKTEIEKQNIEFVEKSPVNILSEGISKSDFEKIALAIYEEIDSVDGIIITCGSDTLAYISSFVGLLFNDTKIPITLVAANKIMDYKDSNGYVNFSCAVELIMLNVVGVFVPYRNSDNVMYIHNSTMLTQANSNDDFFSLYKPYGIYDKELKVICDTKQTMKNDVFSKENPPKFQNSVLMIHPYPMQNYKVFENSDCKAVIHSLYHSATADDKSANSFVKDCKAKGKEVFLCSAKCGQKFYSSADSLIKSGALMLFDITSECAYIKLLFAVNQDKYSIKEFMEI